MAIPRSEINRYLRRRNRAYGLRLHRSLTVPAKSTLAAAFTANDVARPVTFQAVGVAQTGAPLLTLSGGRLTLTYLAGNLALAIDGNGSRVSPYGEGGKVNSVVALNPAADEFMWMVNGRVVARGAMDTGFPAGAWATAATDVTAGPATTQALAVFKGQLPAGAR